MACLLSSKHKVLAIDTDTDKICEINSGISPIEDREIQEYLRKNTGIFEASVDVSRAIRESDVIIVALPTNYDEGQGQFDTSIIEKFLILAEVEKFQGTVVIKSTIPVGFTSLMNERFEHIEFVFSPEFLREGSALKDNFFPSRVVVGSSSKKSCEKYLALLRPCIKKSNPEEVITGFQEAELIKLAANSYLAMRVGFFNELDNYLMAAKLDSKAVFDGICSDHRVGDYYNNPSFGYGGYCLPKDTKQMLNLYKDVGTDIFQAIVDTNIRRLNFIVADILSKSPKIVCLYQLAMKAGSDNFRESSIIKVAKLLMQSGVKVVFFDQSVDLKELDGIKKVTSFDYILDNCDLVIANRLDKDCLIFGNKLYSRDIYSTD